MSSDTTINRTGSSDSTELVNNRKNKSDNFSISQSSFFNELLNLSKFEAKIPPSSPPANSTSSPQKSSEIKSKDGDENAKPQPEDISRDASPSSTDSAAFVAQLASQPIPVLRETDTGKIKSDRTRNGKEKGQIQSASTEKHPAAQVVDTKNTLPTTNAKSENVALPQQSIDPKNVDPSLSLASPTVDTQINEQASGPIPAQVPANEPDNHHAGKKGVADNKSKNSSHGEKIVGENATNLQASSAPSKSKPDIAKLERDQSAISSKADDKKSPSLNGSTPVNRRAERLAERTHSQKPSDDSSQSEDQKPTPKDQSNTATVSATTPANTVNTPNSVNVPDPLSTAPMNTVSAPISAVVDTPITSTISNNPGASTASSDRVTSVNAIGATSAIPSIGTQSLTNNTYSFSATNPSNAPSSSGGAQQAARTNSGTSISPYQEVKLVQRVLRGLEQLGDGGGQVKLRLHPPELGALQMSLRMEAGKMTAKMEVESTTARDALLNNLQTLKDRLADQGMTVESFDVQISADTSGSGMNGSNLQQNGNPNSNSSWENANSRFAQLNNNRIPSPTSPERTPAQAWTRTNGSLDLTV